MVNTAGVNNNYPPLAMESVWLGATRVHTVLHRTARVSHVAMGVTQTPLALKRVGYALLGALRPKLEPILQAYVRHAWQGSTHQSTGLLNARNFASLENMA